MAMAKYIIKTEGLSKQVRLTIPAKLAEKTGITSGQYMTVETTWDKGIIIRRLKLGKKGVKEIYGSPSR